VRDVAEVFSDEPDRFFRGHPMAIVKSREVNRPRVAPKRPFASQVEVDVEITHRQLAQGAIDRLAITTAGEIGFRYCAPVSAHFKNCDDVIGVLFCFQIEDQWRKTNYPQRGGSENSTVKA